MILRLLIAWFTCDIVLCVVFGWFVKRGRKVSDDSEASANCSAQAY